MLWPDPLCRKCERHLAGNGALWSARLVFLTTRFCVGPQNLPASAEALAMSEACGWTSDCRKTKLNYLYVWSNVCDFDIQIEKENKNKKQYFFPESSTFTSARGSSLASEQICHLPRRRRTYFRCSAASGQMSPTVCCYKCWGRLLPESLFSSTHPRKTTNHIG